MLGGWEGGRPPWRWLMPPPGRGALCSRAGAEWAPVIIIVGRGGRAHCGSHARCLVPRVHASAYEGLVDVAGGATSCEVGESPGLQWRRRVSTCCCRFSASCFSLSRLGAYGLGTCGLGACGLELELSRLGACGRGACGLIACGLITCSLSACSLGACGRGACGLGACGLGACGLGACGLGEGVSASSRLCLGDLASSDAEGELLGAIVRLSASRHLWQRERIARERIAIELGVERIAI